MVLPRRSVCGGVFFPLDVSLFVRGKFPKKKSFVLSFLFCFQLVGRAKLLLAWPGLLFLSLFPPRKVSFLNIRDGVSVGRYSYVFFFHETGDHTADIK